MRYKSNTLVPLCAQGIEEGQSAGGALRRRNAAVLLVEVHRILELFALHHLGKQPALGGRVRRGCRVAVPVRTNRNAQPLALGIVAGPLGVHLAFVPAIPGSQDGKLHTGVHCHSVPVDSALVLAHVDAVGKGRGGAHQQHRRRLFLQRPAHLLQILLNLAAFLCVVRQQQLHECCIHAFYGRDLLRIHARHEAFADFLIRSCVMFMQSPRFDRC